MRAQSPTTAAVAPSEPHVEQHTLLRSLVLHLFPSVAVLAGALIAAPSVVRAGFPAELAILLSSLLLGVPLRLGYLFYQGARHQGRLTLRGIVLYWGRMPWWHYLLLVVPLLAYALGVDVVLQPVSRTLIAQAFWWLPPSLLPSAAALRVTPATLITGLLMLVSDGIIAPFVEELYYRGYLLPRLARLGWLAPVINSVLFTLGHFWQPYNYPLIFLLVLPEVCLVYWKRNVKISIIVHCTGNTLAAVLWLILLLMAK